MSFDSAEGNPLPPRSGMSEQAWKINFCLTQTRAAQVFSLTGGFGLPYVRRGRPGKRSANEDEGIQTGQLVTSLLWSALVRKTRKGRGALL